MARKRRKKSQVKQSASSPRNDIPMIHPAGQLTVEQLLHGDLPSFEDSILQILEDSEQLANEPEFIDLYMDREITMRSMERWLEKYSKRLTAAEEEGPDEFQEVFFEMRARVITEIISPEFRKDVLERLQTLQARLKSTNELDKLELVTLLIPMLQTKDFPWDVCGLILEIYARTMQEEIQKAENNEAVLDEVVEALESEAGGPVDLEELVDSPEKLEEMSSKILSKPGLRERLEQQLDEMLDEFESELGQGKVALNLFTIEEISLPIKRLEAEYGKPVTELQPSDEIKEQTFEIMRQCVADIMTPERMRRFRKDVQAIAKDWLKKRNRWGAALQAELSWLETDQYEESKFILAAYLGQMVQGTASQESQPKPKKRRFFGR